MDDGYVRGGRLQRARGKDPRSPGLRRARREEMSRAPAWIAVIAGLIAVGVGGRVDAQRGGAQPPPPAPRAAAPIDLTGYWVSIVTQDWRWRMVTPAKGDYQGIQLTPAGSKIADA